jgi:methylglutaconyl-CoA hydratase
MSELLTQNTDSIATFTLNRPEKRNALNEELIGALGKAFAVADHDPGVSVVVIKGAGTDFCSGADLSSLKKISKSDILENLEDADSLKDLFLQMRRLRIPIVAAVHGRALAGGCGLATACDIVVASKSSRFGYPEVKIGFVPAMVMAILRRNLSEKRSFELVSQGFDFAADEAERIGLINHVFDDSAFEEDVERHVSIYREVSRSAVMLSKRLLYQMDGLTFESALSIGAEVNAIARLTDDCKDGIARFLEK